MNAYTEKLDERLRTLNAFHGFTDRIPLSERVRAALRFRRRYTLTAVGEATVGPKYRPVPLEPEGR